MWFKRSRILEEKEEKLEQNQESQKETEEETKKEEITETKAETEAEPETKVDVKEELMDEIEKTAKEKENNNEEEEKEAPLKKYLFYVSKEFENTIDNLSLDKRTAFINEAIQMKIDSTKANFQTQKINKIIFQAFVVFLTVCITTPIALFIMNKAIMLTFENYKYSQYNFEKLYKQRFESDRAYMRSVHYNKLYQEMNKKKK